jgi:formylmethanofuran dehydrogenase subunit D
MLGDEEAGIPHYKGIPVSMAVRDCEDKIEVSEE